MNISTHEVAAIRIAGVFGAVQKLACSQIRFSRVGQDDTNGKNRGEVHHIENETHSLE